MSLVLKGRGFLAAPFKPFIFAIPSRRTGSPRSAGFALRGVLFSPRGICLLNSFCSLANLGFLF